jgi:hypothetical protein
MRSSSFATHARRLVLATAIVGATTQVGLAAGAGPAVPPDNTRVRVMYSGTDIGENHGVQGGFSQQLRLSWSFSLTTTLGTFLHRAPAWTIQRLRGTYSHHETDPPIDCAANLFRRPGSVYRAGPLLPPRKGRVTLRLLEPDQGGMGLLAGDAPLSSPCGVSPSYPPMIGFTGATNPTAFMKALDARPTFNLRDTALQSKQFNGGFNNTYGNSVANRSIRSTVTFRYQCGANKRARAAQQLQGGVTCVHWYGVMCVEHIEGEVTQPGGRARGMLVLRIYPADLGSDPNRLEANVVAQDFVCANRVQTTDGSTLTLETLVIPPASGPLISSECPKPDRSPHECTLRALGTLANGTIHGRVDGVAPDDTTTTYRIDRITGKDEPIGFDKSLLRNGRLTVIDLRLLRG